MPMSAPAATDDSSSINGHDDSIRPLCIELARRVNRFLEAEAETPLLKRVQAQTEIALGVIDTALDKYRYVNWPKSLLGFMF